MLQRSKFAIASSKFASVATEEERERERREDDQKLVRATLMGTMSPKGETLFVSQCQVNLDKSAHANRWWTTINRCRKVSRPLGSKPAVVAARLREPAWSNRADHQVVNLSLLTFPIADTNRFPILNDYKQFTPT